jgi:hypothetical protein
MTNRSKSLYTGVTGNIENRAFERNPSGSWFPSTKPFTRNPKTNPIKPEDKSRQPEPTQQSPVKSPSAAKGTPLTADTFDPVQKDCASACSLLAFYRPQKKRICVAVLY